MADELHDQKRNLEQLADELRVKLHLAGMEVKQLWEETLEPQLRELDRKFDAATKDMREDLGEEMAKLERKIRDVVEDLAD